MINSAIFWVFPSFLLSSVVSLTATLDSGLSITSFGVTVDTFSLVASLEAHLQDTYGRSLAQRSSKRCLDSDYRLGFFSYAPYTTGCDPRKESQNWRLVGGALKTGSSQLATEGCLTCWSQAEDCFLYLMACRAPKAASQQFHVRIHASQLNLVKGTIGFSVHSGLYPGRCIGTAIYTLVGQF